MATIKIASYKHICERCKFDWISELERPKRCPDCNHDEWDKPRKMRAFICKRCQHEWIARLAEPSMPRLCPRCQCRTWNADPAPVDQSPRAMAERYKLEHGEWPPYWNPDSSTIKTT